MQLIVEFPMHMAQLMGDLVAAIVRRMQSCQSGSLKCSLLLIFARLVSACPNSLRNNGEICVFFLLSVQAIYPWLYFNYVAVVFLSIYFTLVFCLAI